MKKRNTKRAAIIFAVTLVIALGCLIGGFIKTDAYNKTKHVETFAGEKLFSADASKDRDVTIVAVPRSSTWGKIFDFDHKGITENNYQAFTYDFTVSNNTKDQVSNFSFVMKFSKDVYLASAWNGALEIHNVE
ncbi:MAG: hypothetical protein J5489_03270, partial [Lachnospiraceae bacterium]|nr:hypothetical protein [Lachnospiraceae bacterium]